MNTHQQITLVFYDVPYEAKCARRKDSRSGCTECCEQIHSRHSHTTAIQVFKTFYNAQLTLLVVPTNTNIHEIFYSEHCELVLNVGFSLKPAHSSSRSGRHLK